MNSSLSEFLVECWHAILLDEPLLNDALHPKYLADVYPTLGTLLHYDMSGRVYPVLQVFNSFSFLYHY